MKSFSTVLLISSLLIIGALSHTIKKSVKIDLPVAHHKSSLKVVNVDPIKVMKTGAKVAGAMMTGAKLAVKAKHAIQASSHHFPQQMYVEERVHVKKSKVPAVVAGAVAGSIIGASKGLMKMKSKSVAVHEEIAHESIPLPHQTQESLLIQPKTVFHVTKVDSKPISSKAIKHVKMEPSGHVQYAKKKMVSVVMSPLHVMSKFKSHFLG